jgi:hypothetical protein
MAATGTLPHIIQLQDGTYATPDGRGGWAPYTGPLPGGGSAAGDNNSFKVGDSESINHAWDIVNNINDARQLSSKPLSTGTASAAVTSIPIIGGLVGQNRANLQTKLGAVAGDLRQIGIRTLYQQTGQKGVGSVARNQAEQQALQSSLAPIGYIDDGKGHVAPSGAQPDAATLVQGLNQAQAIYYRHLARLHGMNPDDPNSLALISAAAKDPALRAKLFSRTQQVTPPPASGTAPPDHGITTVAPPILKDDGTGNAATSSSTQTVEDPHLKAVGARITQMLNSKVPDEQIRAFAQANAPTANISEELAFRRNNPGSIGAFTVSPEFYHRQVPLTGVRKAIATLDTVPVAGPTLVGAADTATMGASPDIAGVIHGVTGAGPTREDVIKARDISASENPGSTFAGNAMGAILSPFGRGGGIGRTALNAGAYGFFGSEDPSLDSRLLNATIAGTIGAAAHGATGFAANSVRPVYRAGRQAVLTPIIGPEAAATDAALGRAATQMPAQDMRAITAQHADLTAHGANPPAAAVLNRSGQDFLGKLASGSPAARGVSEQAAGDYRKALPASIADDFNQAIMDASPDHTDPSKLFNKPVREIANDVQEMAGREYETGMKPIAGEPLKITPEIVDTLGHERIPGAIRDALSSHNLDEPTRNLLRGLPGQLKALASATIPGAKPAAQAAVREQYAKGIPMTVDGARNIATALDRTAAKLQDGSEAGVELRRLSKELRTAIGDQYPEYAPINSRYASRMRAIDVLDETRKNFLNDTPEGIDALAKTSEHYSDVPNEPEFRDAHANPQGPVLPTNRQYAMAGAREAASVNAGAGTGKGAVSTADKLANGPNQQARNEMVLGPQGAETIAARAGAKAQVSSVLDRIAKGPTEDQTAKWFSLGKRALMYKLTGGTAHYAAAYALSGVPGMSSADAARVVAAYTNAKTADQAFNALSRAYGAQRTRMIMARMAGVASGAATQHSAPSLSPVGAQ